MNNERIAFPDSELTIQNPETPPADSEPHGPFVPPLYIPNITFHRPAYRRQTRPNLKKMKQDPRLAKYCERYERYQHIEPRKRRISALWLWLKSNALDLIAIVIALISLIRDL